MRVLVVNAGSSSLKLRVLDGDDRVVTSRDLDARDEDVATRELSTFIGDVEFDAAGHRVVHGGHVFRESVVVTGEVMERLASIGNLAPLHNPPALAALEAVRDIAPDRPSIACFDTAFHATLPDRSAVYAVPWRWTEDWGIRRFGFHGLNHAYVARRVPEILGRDADELRIVSCHLGAGASLCAIAGGRSVDTTMGFTPLEGLVMATRSGSVDPGALLWVLREQGLHPDDIERVLDHESGLLGLSGVAPGMRDVITAADRGDRRATLAVEVYLHRLRAGIAAMAAAMDGVDAVAFTGGVGEGSARIRLDTCRGVSFLGVDIDPTANESVEELDVDVSIRDAPVRTVVVQAREDLTIAAEVRRLAASA
ncbi:MAG TPA: acetate/propionate family kinase [Actinomycetota bacterium]|nr:acetate/propionate family kinase [Actinomycetota bacterium]